MIVAGGGAAGLLLARELSRNDINFALLEKNSRTGSGTSAKSKGVVYAVNVAKKMDDPFVLDKLHDNLAKEGYYKSFKL